MRLLVIEDDPEMMNYLETTLKRESFAVDCASDGKKGSYLARTNEYDVIILDNVLPEKTGKEVCRDIRGQGKGTPILVLSVKSQAEEKAELLDAGADDYITKPYSHKELLSRIRALTRRPKDIKGTKLHCQDISLDKETYEVKRNGKNIKLTGKEFSLLELLMTNKGKIVSRGTILEHVWDINGDPLSKTVETHILNLRKKLEKGKKKIIETVPGRGYRVSD